MVLEGTALLHGWAVWESPDASSSHTVRLSCLFMQAGASSSK